ncbi:MAG: O-antigen ligase family protein [Phycisphaerales bacterium]
MNNARAPSSRPEEQTAASTPGLIGVVLILAPTLARAMSQAPALPYWDFDPLIYPASMVGMGPWVSMTCDAIVLAGAALCFWGARRYGLLSGRAGLVLLLVAAGCVPVVFHGWLSPFATIGQQRIGSAWVSAMIGAAALSIACRERSTRALAASVLLGFVLMLASRGLYQVLIEHPQTVADFRANRERVFAAQGWSPDSPMARSYERRLLQSEASAWFGLSNVYGSFAAACLAGIAAWLLGAVRTRAASMTIGVLTLGLLAALTALVLAQSKGATVALGFGVALLPAAWWHRRTPARSGLRAGKWFVGLPALLTLVALGAIAIRGVVGLRVGELSLLFRAWYIEAATRIALGGGPSPRPLQPLMGVGPDGFKDAYLVAKNPMSPEEITSPHSIFFDWWACLGVFGIAWGIVLAIWLIGAGRAAFAFESTPPLPDSTRATDDRWRVRLAVGVAVAATFASILAHQDALSPGGAGAYVVGLLLWCVVSGALAAWLPRGPNVGLGLCAAATVLAVHGQIEVTGSLSNSAGAWALMIGCAASDVRSKTPSSGGRRPINAIAASVASLAAAITLLVFGAFPSRVWEHGARVAAEALSPVATARRMLDESVRASARDRIAMLDLAASELRAVLNRPVEPRERALAQAAEQAEAIVVPRAIELLKSLPGGPGDWRLDRERARLQLGEALRRGPPAPTIDSPPWLLPTETSSAGAAPWRSSLLAWNATALHAAAQSAGEQTPEGRRLLRRSLESLDRAQVGDPYNLMIAWRRFDLADRLGLHEAAREHARLVLRLNELTRLDPTRVLSSEDQARADRAARESGNP